MKQFINLVILATFLLFNSCNYRVYQEVNLPTKPAVKMDINPNINTGFANLMSNCAESSVYVNVINGEQCFTCAPVFIMVAEKLMTSAIPKDNLWFVFPSMRKVLQKDFLKANFGLDIDYVKVVFDSEVFDYLQEQYELDGNSNLLCLNQDKELLSKTAYERANYNELFSVIP
ncbi:MAG: hypothetical protein ISR55_10405 [Bacteroidetes bacterium]|nr:hypothetical protein [Bacteroidota bacterium]MBL6964226.1 hypothetical protein [Bacteroidota bacterium]